MNNIIIQLLDIADKADKNDDIDLAHKLDIYAKHLLQIKTAQYVGAQGYAIRNSRCWTNCYRTKRQASNISAHEAWSNCHKEYIESINKDGTAWDKYANANNTIKIASKTSNTLSYHIKFARSIKDNLAHGSSLSYAIKNSLHNYESYLGKEIAIISKNLNKLAKQTSSNYSSDLYDAAESLQKEAQGFMANLVNQVRNVGQNVGQYAKNVGKNMPGLGRGILNVLKAPFTPNPQLISGYSNRVLADPATRACAEELGNLILKTSDKQVRLQKMITNIENYKKNVYATTRNLKIDGQLKENMITMLYWWQEEANGEINKTIQNFGNASYDKDENFTKMANKQLVTSCSYFCGYPKLLQDHIEQKNIQGVSLPTMGKVF